VKGFKIPFRVTCLTINDGTRIYLGLSEQYELRVLRNLRLRFSLLWLLLVFFGFEIVFFTTRRMLSHIREITEAASRIGRSDLSTRVPTSSHNDEVSQLALTLNHMLDRIESAVHQLHTITGSLAHDLRSPLTAIRVKLEASLSAVRDGQESETIVFAIDELDRLTDFLTKSLDVAEAKADALRLNASKIDLESMLKAMIDLYEPSMSEKDHRVRLESTGPLKIMADDALIRRMIANLFDNELKHLPPGFSVTIKLHATNAVATLLVQDDGPGFSPEILNHVFERRVRGQGSKGHGLGLAFVEAVARAHKGTVSASNRSGGGAQIAVSLPLAVKTRSGLHLAAVSSSK
jgi:signal transduction histidine kinase